MVGLSELSMRRRVSARQGGRRCLKGVSVRVKREGGRDALGACVHSTRGNRAGVSHPPQKTHPACRAPSRKA